MDKAKWLNRRSTVRGCVNPAWLDKLAPAILDSPADSVVGRRILGYLATVDAALIQMDEDRAAFDVLFAATAQCSVWYFG